MRDRADTAVVDIKIRMKEPLRAELERSAKERGISMNAEMVSRLSRQFDAERALDQAWELAYGPRLAVLLAIIGRAANEIGRYAPFPSNWLDQPHLFEEVASAIGEILDAFRPPGRSGLPNPVASPPIVRMLLAAVKDPDHLRDQSIARILLAANAHAQITDIEDWARPLHAKLREAAERLHPLRLEDGAGEHLKTRGWEENQ